MTSRVTGDAPGGRLPWLSAMAGAVVVSLVRPVSWALGLAGFLAGGGLLLVTAPVVVLPTPTGLQNALGAPVSTLVVGTPSLPLVAVIVGSVIAGVTLVVAGTVAGAWAERQAIPVALGAAADEGMLGARDLAGAPGTAGVAAVRLLGLVPVVVAVAVAWPSLYAAAYHQLVLPRELVTPLPLRVVGDVPWTVAALGLAWLLADAAAALGVRRLVLERRRIPAAWLLGWADLVRRPARTLGTAVLGLLVLAVLLGPALLAASAGWSRVRDVLLEGRDPLTVFVTVGGWVAIWLGGLVLAGVGAAVRAAAWTLESVRRD